MDLNNIHDRQQNINLYTYDHAIVAGVGGIGSWVALDLALSGKINTIHLIDPDDVESSNLNRTPFRLCDIGFPKVDALKYLILERRVSVNIHTYREKTSPDQIGIMKSRIRYRDDSDSDRLLDYILIVDCRDDVYEDLYEFKCKYYKVGYDGLSVTIDGNPRNTAVWGQANSYRYTPSFIAPAQMIAAMVVTDALSVKDLDKEEGDVAPSYDVVTNTQPFDLRGRINKAFTVDTRDVTASLYREYLGGVIGE